MIIIFVENHTDLARKETLVVDLSFNPSHEIIDVLAGSDLQRCFDILPICPKIFVLWTCAHDWASFLSAKLKVKEVSYWFEFEAQMNERIMIIIN